MISFCLSANAFYKMLWLPAKRKWQVIFSNFINASFLHCSMHAHYFLDTGKDQHYFSKSFLSSLKEPCRDFENCIPDPDDLSPL